jgi:hypothetical protein
VMTRSPFLVCISHPHRVRPPSAHAAAASLADCYDKVPISHFSPFLRWFRVIVMMRYSTPSVFLPLLYLLVRSLSSPCPQARGRCPLGYASSSAGALCISTGQHGTLVAGVPIPCLHVLTPCGLLQNSAPCEADSLAHSGEGVPILNITHGSR